MNAKSPPAQQQRNAYQNWSLQDERVVGIAGNQILQVKNEFLATHLKFVLGASLYSATGERTPFLEKLCADVKLQDHLERLFALSPQAIQNFQDLYAAVTQFSETEKSGSHQNWNPLQIEGLIEAYLSYGSEEVQLLLNVLASPEEGGLGYRLSSKPYSLARWEIDRERRIIYLPEWYTGLLYTLTDSFGGKTQRITNRLAAELLKTAIHEEFLHEESERSALHRGIGGALMVAGAVVGSIDAAPIVVLMVMAPQAVEGISKMAGLNGGRGYNPAGFLLGGLGRKLGGDSGELVATVGYEIVSLVLCFKGSTRLIQGPKTEEGIRRAIQSATETLERETGNLLHETPELAQKYGGQTLKPSVELGRDLFPGRSEGFYQEFSQIKGEVKGLYGAPSSQMPLALQDAATFSGGRYAEIELQESLSAYRAWAPGTNAHELGKFWTLSRSQGSFQARIDQALLLDWAELVEKPWLTSQATRLTGMQVPAGKTIMFGEVGQQTSGFVGGTSQFMISGRAQPEWKIIFREVLK